MRYKSTIFLIICSLSFIAYAQRGSIDLEIMQQHFKNFEYNNVVKIADKILANKDQLSNHELLQIYEMKAVSHYSLFEMNTALSCFVEILKIDPEFTLDPIKTSPKIVNFFQGIKSNFKGYQMIPTMEPEITKTDTVKLFFDSGKVFKSALCRSMVLPGWGQSYLGAGKKGLFLTAASLAALGSTIYFSIDCADKRSDYLNEIDKSLMDDKYEKYNTSYKIRNCLLTSCAVLWLYSQVDLLFFQQHNIDHKVRIGIRPSIDSNIPTTLYCSISF